MTELAGIHDTQYRQRQYHRRVYPLDARLLTEEQIAVAFAMTSRVPDPFDVIAQRVSEEKAADFHERWVLGYGHASVAEHAVVHLAIENISRLACDGLEDNRLASYTEKSSRYQVIDADCFHTPAELDGHPALKREYETTCRYLFAVYQQLIDGCIEYLRCVHPQRGRESDSAYYLRLRRINRIRTIHGSLAIEGNRLSEDQIGTILDAEPVAGPLRYLKEPRTALAALYTPRFADIPYRSRHALSTGAHTSDGAETSRRGVLTMNPTCSLVARPVPATALLIAVGEYSAIWIPASAPANRTAPRAWPSVSAL